MKKIKVYIIRLGVIFLEYTINVIECIQKERKKTLINKNNT